MRLRSRRVHERDALGDEPADARAECRVNHVARAFDPHARVADQALGHQLRLEPGRQVGELMDDHVGPRGAHRGAERGAVVNVDHGRRDSGSAQFFSLGGDARGPGNLVAGCAQQRQHPPPYRTRRSGKENSLRHWSTALLAKSG